MDQEKNNSRVNKYDKRRKTTKSITVLVGIAIGLIILLIGIWIFGGNDKSEEETDQDKNQEVTENQDNGDSSEANDSKDNDKNQEDEDKDKDKEEDMDEDKDKDTSEDDEKEESDDESVQQKEIPTEDIEDVNVIEAYTANWKPVGTNQEEPHTTTFDEGSEDWEEMMKAIAYALEIEGDQFVNHWIGNGGEQRVNGHVQSKITDEHYTVYLEWQENEGWKPIKVEQVERFIHPKQAN